MGQSIILNGKLITVEDSPVISNNSNNVVIIPQQTPELISFPFNETVLIENTEVDEVSNLISVIIIDDEAKQFEVPFDDSVIIVNTEIDLITSIELDSVIIPSEPIIGNLPILESIVFPENEMIDTNFVLNETVLLPKQLYYDPTWDYVTDPAGPPRPIGGNVTIENIGGVRANFPITGATKTKITYDSKGLVTFGENISASDVINIPYGTITAITVQDAINEIEDNLSREPAPPNMSAVTWSTAYDYNILGVRNGINMVFSITDNFLENSPRVHVNGLRLQNGQGWDYHESSSNSITFSFPIGPTDLLLIDYIKI